MLFLPLVVTPTDDRERNKTKQKIAQVEHVKTEIIDACKHGINTCLHVQPPSKGMWRSLKGEKLHQAHLEKVIQSAPMLLHIKCSLLNGDVISSTALQLSMLPCTTTAITPTYLLTPLTVAHYMCRPFCLCCVGVVFSFSAGRYSSPGKQVLEKKWEDFLRAEALKEAVNNWTLAFPGEVCTLCVHCLAFGTR